MKLELARLREEDKKRWRECCALVEVSQSPPADMTVGQAQQAWVNYYATIEELHKRYEIDEDPSDVSIMPASGRIILDED